MTSNSYQTQIVALPDEYSIRRTLPLATTREWVMALNPTVTAWYVYPFIDVFSPFNEAKALFKNIRLGFRGSTLNLKFMGQTLAKDGNLPLTPKTARLSALQVLEAIDTFSSTSSRWDVIGYWGSLGLVWLVASFLTLPINLTDFADLGSVQWATFLSLVAIQGFALTAIGYLIHNWTHWFRKKVVLASERLEELHSAILECRNVKAWGPSVQQIFGDIEKFNDLASGDSLSQLKIHNTKQAQQIDLLSKELEAAQKQINTYKTNATSLLGDLFIESEDKSFKIPVSFFKHAIFQTGEPGFSDSIALPILILTAWSLRAQPPLPKEKISTIIRQRVKSNAEIVRNLCKDLPQYRGKITKDAQWKTYVSSLETPILKILVPMSDDGKSISGSGHFESKFEYLAKVRPLPDFICSADRQCDACMT